MNTLKKNFTYIWHLPRKFLVLLITGYQKVLSPDHGLIKGFFPNGYCKFTPSCSEYAKLSLRKHGVLWGSLKVFWRVCRCNPWSKGGEDNV